MAVKTMMTELRWFLRGDTNIKYLVKNGCNIWNGDAYKAYTTKLEKHWEEGGDIYTKPEFIDEIKNCENGFAEKWGDLGPIYGKQWRRWKTDSVSLDQIQDLISELKTNPDSRRLMVNAWNVGELDQMTLPPCHYGFQVYTRELKIQERMDWLNKKNNTDERYRTLTLDELNVPTRAISLMWNQRSVDTFLGLPFNIASYAALLCLIAEEVNMIPDELIGNLGDVHLYKNHIEQATEQISREAYPLPQIKLSNVNLLEGEWDYELIDYKYHPSIKAPLSN